MRAGVEGREGKDGWDTDRGTMMQVIWAMHVLRKTEDDLPAMKSAQSAQ